MDQPNMEFMLFQREQLQHNVLDPLQRIKTTIGRSIEPYQVDILKSLLNRDVRNFALTEVYDGEHLIDVFDLCYGKDNLKFMERLLNEANLQNLAQMMRSWKSKNKSLVPNVFYQYGFFPLWIRVNCNFINFLKHCDDIFITLKKAFGIPQTDLDHALDPLVFMGVSLGKRDVLLCVLVPHSLRHHIKTSLQSTDVASQLKSACIDGIYFSRVKTRYNRDDITGSQLSISSACESMTSDDFGELYDAAYEDITNKYRNETPSKETHRQQDQNGTPQEEQLNPINQQHGFDRSKFDVNGNIYNGYDYSLTDHYSNRDTKPQLVQISSDYVIQEPSNAKSLKSNHDDSNNIKGYSDDSSGRHGNEEFAKDNNPRLVKINSGYVNQDLSNKVTKVDDKCSYGKCFFVDYRSTAKQNTKPNRNLSPANDKINTTPVPHHYDDYEYQSRDDRHLSRDAQDDALFSQKNDFTFEEPSNFQNELITWSDEEYKERDLSKESPWYNHELQDEHFCTAEAPKKRDIHLGQRDSEERDFEPRNRYYHGNDRHGDYERIYHNGNEDYHENNGSRYYNENVNGLHGNQNDKCLYGNGYNIQQPDYDGNNQSSSNSSDEQQNFYRYSENENNRSYGSDYYGNKDRDNGDSQPRYYGTNQGHTTDGFPNDEILDNNDKKWYENEGNHSNNNDYNGLFSSNRNSDDDNKHNHLDNYYDHQGSNYNNQGYKQDQRNGYHGNNDVMIPEQEPPRRSSELLSYQPSSSSLSNDPMVRRSTPNSSVSGFSSHELSYNKSRDGDMSRSMPILYPRETEQRSPSERRKFAPKYDSQADLEDNVFVDAHAHASGFGAKPDSSPSLYAEPPSYQDAMVKKSYLSLSSVSVDVKCKKVKSPLLSSQSVGSIYREKELLLNREELQESIRSAEVKEWEKLLDKTKEFLKAAKIGDEDEVQYFLNEGVDADYKNEFGHTALMIACREGHLPVVQVLITYNAELNIQDKYGKSAMHEAAWSGKHHVIQPLVSKGADMDIIDEEGRTPLQFAALRGKTKVAQVLLLIGADSSIENKDGETAIELAYRCRHKDIVKLLLDSTDKETRKTMQGRIRKLQIQRLKSATSLPNLTKNNRSKDFNQSRSRPEMRRQRSCVTQ